MTQLRTAYAAVLLALVGCAQAQRPQAEYGSRHTHRFQQPPLQAAQCFARNAQEHSSALIAEVNATRQGGAQVIVRVKNGVTYATADLWPSGSVSTGTITLMVRTSGRRNDLLEALVEGC